MSDISVFLRDVGDDEDECWVVCAKGDPGSHEFVPLEDLESQHNAYTIAFDQAMANGAKAQHLQSQIISLREALGRARDMLGDCELNLNNYATFGDFPGTVEYLNNCATAAWDILGDALSTIGGEP